MERASKNQAIVDAIGEPIVRGPWFNVSLAVAHGRQSVFAHFLDLKALEPFNFRHYIMEILLEEVNKVEGVEVESNDEKLDDDLPKEDKSNDTK